MIVYNIFSLLVILLVVPVLAGAAICRLLSLERNNLASHYLVGSFTIWAIMQIVSVPLIVTRCSFLAFVFIVSFFLLVLCVYGIISLKKTSKGLLKLHWQKKDYSTVFAGLLLTGLYIIFAVSLIRYQYISHDDSRFVVTGIDIVRTNRMFLTNPATGFEISGFWGELHRDTVSPWAVYFAYISKISNVSVTIIAHTVLPQTLLLCLVSAYYLLAECFFKSKFAVFSVCILALLVNLFGVRDGWDSEAFTVTTIWQGKSSVAAFGIVTLFLSSIWIFHNPEGWKKYIFYYIVCFALCLMSGMGIIFSGIITGTIGVAYGIIKKNIRVSLKILAGLIIPLGYYGVSLLNY